MKTDLACPEYGISTIPVHSSLFLAFRIPLYLSYHPSPRRRHTDRRAPGAVLPDEQCRCYVTSISVFTKRVFNAASHVTFFPYPPCHYQKQQGEETLARPWFNSADHRNIMTSITRGNVERERERASVTHFL